MGLLGAGGANPVSGRMGPLLSVKSSPEQGSCGFPASQVVAASSRNPPTTSLPLAEVMPSCSASSHSWGCHSCCWLCSSSADSLGIPPSARSSPDLCRFTSSGPTFPSAQENCAMWLQTKCLLLNCFVGTEKYPSCTCMLLHCHLLACSTSCQGCYVFLSWAAEDKRPHSQCAWP